MDFQLPEELRLVKDQLRHFVNTEMIPHERETLDGDEGDLKPEWRQRFEKGAKELGIWMMEVPEEFGGPGLDLVGRAVVWQELARTVIFVTHSVFESVYLAQRIVVMTPRPGRVFTEVAIDAPYPRDESFRTSAEYAGYCRLVSQALGKAMAEGGE